MKVIGLTGSIGMGKSFVSAIFKANGVDVFDADETIHELTKKGGDAEKAVLELFPDADDGQGHIHRPKLGMLVFSDEQKLRALEMLLHPLVRKKGDEFYKACEAAGKKMIVQDIPLLFETGADKTCHVVIVVYAPEDIQAERVLSREQMTPEKYEKIKEFQLSSEEKIKKADYVIYTDKDKDAIEEEVKNIIAEVAAMSVS